MDFRKRLVGLQEKMAENSLDLVVYGSCQNFQYLTGLLIEWRRGTDLGSEANNVFVPQNGNPVLTLAEAPSERVGKTWIDDVRILEDEENYEGLLKKVISDLSLKGNTIGLGDHVWSSVVEYIAKTVKKAEFHKAEALMDDMRMIKEGEEIEKLRKVAKLTDRVMEEVAPKIKEGATQHDLALEVEFCGRRLGASDVSFPPAALFVKAGSEVSPNPFTYPRDKGLVRGASVAFDIGFVMDGYCSDFGRSFYYGPASKEVQKAYEALQQAVVETVDKMRDGSMRVCDLFPALEKTLDRLGYGNYLRAVCPTETWDTTSALRFMSHRGSAPSTVRFSARTWLWLWSRSFGMLANTT